MSVAEPVERGADLTGAFVKATLRNRSHSERIRPVSWDCHFREDDNARTRANKVQPVLSGGGGGFPLGVPGVLSSRVPAAHGPGTR